MSPAKFFTQGEKVVWKNLASWAIEDEWVELPGPAEWWPDTEDRLDATGFKFSTKSPKGLQAAMLMVYATEEPEDGSYQRIFPSNSELWVMDDTTATQHFLRNFLRL